MLRPYSVPTVTGGVFMKQTSSNKERAAETSCPILGTLQIPVDTFSATPDGVRMAIES